MATIKRYQTAAGERWEVRYRQPNGIISRKRGFGSKRDASAWASKVETTKAEGAYVSPARGRVTVGDLSVGWLARQEQTLSPSYYRTISYAYAYAYGKHIEPKLAGVPVNKVDSLDVKAWAAAMTRGGSSATVVNQRGRHPGGRPRRRGGSPGVGVQSGAPVQARREAAESSGGRQSGRENCGKCPKRVQRANRPTSPAPHFCRLAAPMRQG